MRTIILLFFAFHGAYVSAAEELLHRAFCVFASPQGSKEVPCYADVVKDTATRITELRIYPGNGSGREAFKHRLQEGQEFVTGVGTLFLTGLDRVFYVEWEWGARTVGLTLYKLGPDGRIKEIFRDGGIYGYRVVNLSGEDALKIVVLDRNEAEGGSIARIYSATSGEFGNPSLVRSKGPISFELKGGN
jgi:hypothetical protein